MGWTDGAQDDGLKDTQGERSMSTRVTKKSERPSNPQKDASSRQERPSIKPPTSSFGVFAVFEACIPGQVPLQDRDGKSSDQGDAQAS